MEYNINKIAIYVEADPLSAIRFLQFGIPQTHPSAALVIAIKACLQGHNVVYNHAFREANCVADDGLSKFGHMIGQELHTIDVVPNFLVIPLLADRAAVNFPRGM
ncbi:hypothetical protein RIF29_39838 [Crotalaria pallida]|uniref:RNase H type-1 domain-containing protein n=1 Tax=Crotalaria pallida TaxID=3830 RepID=A0AAN9E203_CROPI